MLAIVCPGQGSQVPGFLAPWLEVGTIRDDLSKLSEASKTDLEKHGTVSNEATIKDTAVAQPLIVAAGILSASALGVSADLYAGHSVGEITAASLSGVLSPEGASALVGERARLMAGAAGEQETTMAALLGGREEDVLSAIETSGAFVANRNSPGQIVAAGTREAIDALLAAPPARTRAVELKVAGAFHTQYMQSAVGPLAAFAASLAPSDPAAALLTNRDGSTVTDGRAFLDLIVSQVVSPVRWDLCMDSMAAAGVTGLLEVAPAGTLAGLAKRGLKGAERFTLNTPDELDAARDFARAHSGSANGEAQK